jgi:hypothetical protein
VRARWWRTTSGRTTAGVDPRLEAGADEPVDPYPALSELLDDMRELRMTLAADLSAAAGATEDDAHDVAGQIVDADRRELAAFVRRAVGRLSALEPGAGATPAIPVPTAFPPSAFKQVPQQRLRRRVLLSLPAVPLIGALAMSAAAAAGLLPVPGHSSGHVAQPAPRASAPVTSTFNQFEAVLDSDPSPAQLMRAATALHRQLAALIATAQGNPGHVTEVARLLQLEQALLLRKQPPGSDVVLAESRKLAAKLLKLAPIASPSSQPTPASVPTSQSSSPAQHQTQPTPSSTPASQPTKAPTPTPTPTHSTSPSPAPSTSNGYPGHLPGALGK